MDIFTKGSGSTLVEHFAARLTLAIAKGISQAKPAIRNVWDEDAEGVWTLAIILVQWYADQLPSVEAAAVATALQDTGAGSIAVSLGLFRERLIPFVRAAYQAKTQAQLAEAGVYFRAALEQIGPKTISAAVNTPVVSDVQRKIAQRLPVPEEIRAEYDQLLDGAPRKREVEPQQSPGTPVRGADGTPVRAGERKKGSARGERFDRADKDRPAAPPPKLEPTERLLAHLYTRGWSPEDIERITKGPKGS